MGTLKEKKDKLGIDNLGFENQSKLFNDFVNVGGKVVELKSGPQKVLNEKLEKWIDLKEDEQQRRIEAEKKRTEEEIIRQKTQESREKLQSILGKQSPAREKRSGIEEFGAPPKLKKAREPNPTQEYFSRLAARIVCIIYGVISFWGNHFNRNFLDMTLYDLKNGLIENQQILVSILHQDKAFAAEVRKALKEKGYPFYFELIYRYYLIFDDEVFNLIRELRTAENPIQRGKFAFVRLFKKILVLARYHPSLTNAFSRALSHEKISRHLTDNIVDFNLRKLYHTYHFLFYKYYPKILNLVDFYYKDELFLGRKISYSEFLGFNEQDTLGYYTRMWEEEDARERVKAEHPAGAKTQEEAGKQDENADAGQAGAREGSEEGAGEIEKLPEEVSLGLTMIRDRLNFNDVIQYYCSIKDPRMVLPVYDKAFLAATLLETFDKEYSFLFIASNVQFNIFFDRGMRKDVKGILKDLYFDMDDVYKKLYEYVKIINEVKKLKEDSFMPSKEKFTRLHQLITQKNGISRMIRNQTYNIMNDFQKNLQMVLTDYKRDKFFIQNPDEVISYETTFAGKKNSHKETIVDIFKLAYFFAAAMTYLLQNGELSGVFVNLKKPVYLNGLITPAEEDEDIDIPAT